MPHASTASTGLLGRADETAAAEKLARRGRRGDTEIGHLTRGEMVIPLNVMKAKPELMAELVEAMGEMGIDPRSRIVGTPQGPRNPDTGVEEFYDDGDTGDKGAETGPETSGPPGGNESPQAETGLPSEKDDPDLAPDGKETGIAVQEIEKPSYTGIGLIDRTIRDVVNNPAASFINAAVGFTPVGIANTLSGLLGGPTVGGMATAAGRAISSGESLAAAKTDGPKAPEGPDGPGTGINAGDSLVAAEPGRTSDYGSGPGSLPAPDAYIPNNLLTRQTNRLSAAARPRPTPAPRFINRHA